MSQLAVQAAFSSGEDLLSGPGYLTVPERVNKNASAGLQSTAELTLWPWAACPPAALRCLSHKQCQSLQKAGWEKCPAADG